MANLGRRVKLTVKYNNKSMTESIAGYVKSISFTDSIAGQGDQFSFSLSDPKKLWLNKWKPETGAEIYSSASLIGFDGTNKEQKRVFGDFNITGINIDGPPHTVQLSTTSIPRGKGTKTKRTKSYENTSLKNIAGILAGRMKLKLLYQASENPSYDRVQQEKENDLVFAKRLCSEAGFSVKVTTKYLVILDDEDLEAKDHKAVFKSSDRLLSKYSFNETLTEIYNKCVVSYTDAKKKKTISVTFTPSIPKKGDTLFINQEFKNRAEGLRIAKKQLREKNKEMIKGTLEYAGLVNRFAGDTVMLDGFGKMDGKYIITSISGSIGSGTKSTVEVRKVLKGY